MRRRIHLIAGNPLELFTTIIRKLDYEGFTTKRLGVHAAKILSINNTKLIYGQGSSTMDTSSSRVQAYGTRKSVPLTGNAEGEEIVNSYVKA